VVDEALKKKASLTEVLNLPPTSLLSMLLSPMAGQPGYSDPIEQEPSAATQAAADPHGYHVEMIAIAVDPHSRKVLFKDGNGIGGKDYDLVAKLAELHNADLDAGTFRSEHRFSTARELAKQLGVEEHTVRQRVSRCRAKIELLFLTKFDRQLGPDDVIENAEWQGYRLNPYVLLVKPTQLSDSRPMSHLDKRAVTTRLEHS
jgi:hypothetical protein